MTKQQKKKLRFKIKTLGVDSQKNYFDLTIIIRRIENRNQQNVSPSADITYNLLK